MVSFFFIKKLFCFSVNVSIRGSIGTVPKLILLSVRQRKD
jgi:hypothetical protein